jgi:hypothetical protein
MARYGRGLICLTLTEERADYLRLPPMTAENTSRFGTAFTETIEAREGVTTGHLGGRPRAHDSRRHRPQDRPPTTWRAPAMSFRCAHARAGCWCAPDKPRHPSTWHAWRG